MLIDQSSRCSKLCNTTDWGFFLRRGQFTIRHQQSSWFYEPHGLILFSLPVCYLTRQQTASQEIWMFHLCHANKLLYFWKLWIQNNRFIKGSLLATYTDQQWRLISALIILKCVGYYNELHLKQILHNIHTHTCLMLIV